MDIFPLFAKGRDALTAGKCSELRSLTDQIVALMSVPQVQGSLRYAYKVGELGEGAKSKAEGAVFAGAILPRVHQCNPKAAEVIHANMKIDADPPMAAGFAAVKAAFESTYHCMGFSCDHVGGLWLGGDTNYHPGAEPCADHAKIAGYAPGSSVVQHNQLDLDQAELEGFLKEKPPNFAAAKKIYNQGGNSGGYAHVTLATPLAADLVKGTAMTQVGNAKAVGKAKSGAKAGDSEIKISYMSVCKAETSGVKTKDTDGCFTTTGDIHTASKGRLGGEQVPLPGRVLHGRGEEDDRPAPLRALQGLLRGRGLRAPVRDLGPRRHRRLRGEGGHRPDRGDQEGHGLHERLDVRDPGVRGRDRRLQGRMYRLQRRPRARLGRGRGLLHRLLGGDGRGGAGEDALGLGEQAVQELCHLRGGAGLQWSLRLHGGQGGGPARRHLAGEHGHLPPLR